MSADSIRQDALESQLRQACADLDTAVRGGQTQRAEQLLDRHPQIAGDLDAAVELIYTEFVAREQCGQQPRPEEYYRRFPDRRSALREQFEIHALLDEPPDRSSPTAPERGPALLSAAGEVWLDRYEIREELGRGGMGVVLKAHDTQLNRPVAVKVLLAGDLAGHDALDRLRREAEAVAGLQHPNIVQIYEVGQHQDRPCLVFEYVAGESLAEQAAGGPLSAPDAARLVETLAAAVHYAHEHDIVHRDLKPSNVLITRGGIPKITDFGLAKRLAGDSNQTRTGAMIGTPSYMAPEQTGAMKYLGPASDVYSLGAILYELLTGRPPFEAETVLDTARMVISDDPVPPRRIVPGVPRDLETICLKCLQKEPYRRYATAQTLAADLLAFRSGEPIQASPIGPGGRLLKWARRRPAIAALAGVVLLATMSLLTVNLWYTAQLRGSNRRLTDALSEVEHQRTQAESQKAEALHQAGLYRDQLTRSKRGLYALQLGQVSHLWERDPLRGLQLLSDEEICPPELRDFTWHLFHRLCNRQRAVLSEFPTALRAITLTGDSHRLVAGCADGTLVVRELAGESSARIALKAPAVALAVALDDATCRVVDARGNVERINLTDFKPRDEPWSLGTTVTAAAFSPDGRWLAAGGRHGVCGLWNLAERKLVRQWPAHVEGVVSCAFAADSIHFATGSEERNVKVWTRAGEEPLVSINAHSNEILGLAFSPDGQQLATAGGDEYVRLWSLPEGERLAELIGHISPVVAVRFSPDGALLATSARDATVKLWNVQTGTEQAMFKGHVGAPTSLAFSADGLRLHSGGEDRTVRVWDVRGPEPRTPIAGHEGRILSLAFSPDGTRLASGSKDMTVRYWDAATGEELARFTRTHRVRGLALFPRYQLLVAGAEDKTVRFWNLAGGPPLARLTDHPDRVFDLAVSPDRQQFATASDDGTARIWDVAERKVIRTIAAHDQFVSAVAWSPNGKLLATGSQDTTARLWEAATGNLVATLRGHRAWIHSLAFSPDGMTLATGAFDETVRLWDVPSATERAVLRGHTSQVMDVAFSPDGRTLATSTGDRWMMVAGEVKLWDAQTGHVRATFPRQTGPLAFSPDGKRLASGTESGVIEIWETER